MLTANDEVLGHKLAGEWLERAEERDARLLAEHFDRGGEGEKAVTYYLKAAEQAMTGADFAVALELAQRGRALVHEGALLAEVCAVEADARFRCGDLKGSISAATQTLAVVGLGSRAEARALCSIVFSAMFARDVEIPEEAVERLLHASPTPESIVTLTSAFFAMTAFSAYAAKRDMVELCHRRLEEIVPTHAAHAPVAMAWVVLTRGCYKLHFDRDFWGALRCTRDAVARHEGSGAGPILFGRTLITISCVLLGLFEQANEEAARTVATTPAEGPEALSAEAFLCYVLIAQRRFEDAVALAIRVARGKATMVGGLLGIYARFFQMEAHWFMGDREMAKSEASALSDTMAKEPVFAMWYLAILARMRLDEGRADEAVALAERGYAQSRAIRMGEMRRHALLLLVRAEAHHALGHDDIARDAIREAREDILCRAALIPESESEARQAFLENYPDHKRTLELAREWLGE